MIKLLLKIAVATLLFIFVTPASALNNQDVYESIEKDFISASERGMNIKDLSILYKKHNFDSSSIYLRIFFMDSIQDHHLLVGFVKELLRTDYDCRLQLYDAGNLIIKDDTQSIIDTYTAFQKEHSLCSELSQSDKIIVASRILFASIQNPATRNSAIEKLIRMDNNNNIHAYSPYASAYFYFVLAAANMEICLNKGYPNCNAFEKWYPDLVKATQQVTTENDFYPSVIFANYIIDTVYSYSDKHNVSNPFQGLIADR